jgi:hypothetical protein
MALSFMCCAHPTPSLDLPLFSSRLQPRAKEGELEYQFRVLRNRHLHPSLARSSRPGPMPVRAGAGTPSPATAAPNPYLYPDSAELEGAPPHEEYQYLDAIRCVRGYQQMKTAG